jgi:hypothetical protein
MRRSPGPRIFMFVVKRFSSSGMRSADFRVRRIVAHKGIGDRRSILNAIFENAVFSPHSRKSHAETA